MYPAIPRTLRTAALFLAVAATPLLAASNGAAADGFGRAAKIARNAARGDADPSATPYRAHFGWSDVYIPGWFRPIDGKYDLIIHFHGVPFLQEDNIERTRVNAIVVSMNLGIGSGYYSNYFQSPKAFPALLDAIQTQIDKSHRADGAQVGRIALAAWSAGFAAVGSILNQPDNATRIDTVLLADGFHTSYLGNHEMYDEGLMKYVRFAELAEKGERLMVMTHSSIMTEGYPSTTQTTAEFLKLTGLPKHDIAGQLAPRKMRPIYESHRGNLYVTGYEGITKEDHVDHVKAMCDTMFPLLKQRWSK
jgi:hypothetical protein